MLKTLFAASGRGPWIALAGVLVLSFDALLVRMADASPANVAFWRGALMALSLAVVQWLRTGRLGIGAVANGSGLLAVLLFGINTVLFVFSLAHTAVANTIVLLSLAPLFATLISRFATDERPGTDTWIAAAATAVGVGIVVHGSLASGRLLGDALALAASLVLAIALTVLRSRPQLHRIPVVMGSGAVTAGLCVFWASPVVLDASSYLPLAIMGLLQIPLAMVLLGVATRYLGAPEVSLVMLLEILLGPLWVWLVLAEAPPQTSTLGGGVVAVTLTVYFGRRLGRGAR